MSRSSLQPPSPTGGWSREIAAVGNAVVVPPIGARQRQPAGVLDANGRYVAASGLWRYDKRVNLPPLPSEGPIENVSGRWLWGGFLFSHFGHFLAESTGRLWALHNLRRHLSGIVFVQKRQRSGTQLLSFQRKTLDLFGVRINIRIAPSALRIERLLVPGQGFGLGEISVGTPEMRAYVHDKFATSVRPDGPDRLYLSRSGLGERNSMILGETRLDRYLADHGYHIFHPQEHSLEVQIARMRAARQIIVADGSAAHLLGFVARPDQQVAYILRRTWWVSAPVQQIGAFSERQPQVIDALRQVWKPVNPRLLGDLTLAELDFAALQQSLYQTGFIGDGPIWVSLSAEEVTASLERMELIGQLTPEPMKNGP